MRLLTKITALIALLLAATACQLTDRPAQEILWPDASDPYVVTTRDWTRQDAVYDGVNLAFAATATAKSMDWREAFAMRYAEIYGQNGPEAARTLTDQRAAHEEGSGFILALESPTMNVGRLSVRDERLKVFALCGENKLYPLEIRRLKEKSWPASKLEAFFPYANRWQTFYEVRFERIAPGPVTLVVSGPFGQVNLGWEEFK